MHVFEYKSVRSFRRVQILSFYSSPQNLCIENDLDYKVQQPHKVYQSTRTHNQTTVCGRWLTFSIGGLRVYNSGGEGAAAAILNVDVNIVLYTENFEMDQISM